MALIRAVVKLLFLAVVAMAKKKFKFKLWNFVIMGNHIHFLIKPEDGASLSRIMQYIKCNFAKMWNKMHNTKGHVWGNRFFSRIIKDEEDFATVSAYIDQNPVKAGLVKAAEEWHFGGLFCKLKGMFWLVDELREGESLFPSGVPLTPVPAALG
jgi:REP element-mobilizing transposase RayT